MASPGQRQCCDVSRELMNAIVRVDWTKVINILSESSRHVGDSVVTQLINEDQWSTVRGVIVCVEDVEGVEDRTWDIGIVVKSSILLSIADRDWTCLKESPNERFPDSTFQWIIRQACTRATESEVVHFVLPHCADNRLDCVLTILVERGLWQAVERALARGVSDSTKQWAVREACEHCTQTHFVYTILYHCADDQLNRVLTTLVERRLWRAVLYILKRGVSDSSKRWVVLEVCTCCEFLEEYEPSEILLFCADDQVESVLTILVERSLWHAVGVILEKKGVSDSNKQWAVQEACKHCKGYELESLIQNILPHCAVDQLDNVLTTLVERRLWHAVLYVLERGVSDSSKRWVVLEVCACCESVDTQDIPSEIFHFCADDQADCVLTTLVERHQWKALEGMLKKGVNDSNNQWAVLEACKHCEGYELESLMPHCADDQLDSVLTTLVERRQWYAVVYVLKRGVSDSSIRWLLLEVCAYCESVDTQVIPSHIFHLCADDQVDCMLTTLVERRLWKAVGVILKKKGVSDSNKQWAVQEACKHCEGYELEYLIQIILLHCADDQLDSVLTTLVERRLWQAVGVILKKKGVCDFNKQWAVQEACKHCKDDQLVSLIQNILPRCAVDQLFSVLTTLVERRLWHDVLYVLKRGVSDSSKRWVVLEVCACCESFSQEKVSILLLFCADDQVDCVLTTLVERRLWQAVGVILKKKGVSDSNKQWAVREACKHCNNYELESLIENILPHCAADQRDSVLITLVERRLWQAVLYALKRGVSDSSKRWVVLEVCACCESVSQEETLSDILFFCADDQLNSVLTTLVERRLWHAVGVIMKKKGVSDSNKQWAVQEACKHYKENQLVFLIQNILPHCADDQLDSVLTTLVERRLWRAVLYVLKRGVSDFSKRWVVLSVCACCESGVQEQVLSEILLLCADDHADFVLTTLVQRLQWRDNGEMLKLVRELLKQGVSETVGTRLVEETWKATSRHDFIKYVLPHCPLSHLNSVMPNLVKKGELTTVDIVMQRHRKDMETKSFVLPRWYVDVLPLFVERSLWNYVQDILHSVVKKSLYHWTKREGEINEEDSVVWVMVNTCRVNATCAVRLFRAAKEKVPSKVRELHECLGLAEDLCELLYTSLLDQVCVALCSEEKKTDVMTDSTQNLVGDIYITIISCIQTISTNSVQDMVDHVKSEACTLTTLVATLGKLSSSSVRLLYPFLKQYSLYYTCRQENADDEVLLMMFAVLPLVPELQSVALRIMLRHKRWDVISQADLSGVWEQDRRHLLQAAVKQRQWSVVKRWADHTLYDDQRVWALNEALNEKQWDVSLLLADHGLTDIDLMRVHYRLAKYADLDVILHMFERGADVAEVKERLGRMKDNKRIAGGIICCIDDRYNKMKNFEKEIQMAKLVAKYADLAVIVHMFQRGADVAEVRERLGRMNDNKRIPENIKCCIDDEYSQVEDVEKEIQKAQLKALKTACRSCNWISVLFILIRNPSKECVNSALKVAMKKKAWHVVMQLVRLGIDAKQQHSLFSRMMKRQQWGVCRVLLEQGLSVQFCLKVLPQLLEINQWTLVARVMEHEVSDDVRQQVMQRAWDRREGSVVWLCIKSLPTPLSVEEREALFQRAFSCELWQVIKPLVEEKDETGIRHRDTALLEAIEQHEWDLVDHCQRHHADINMKDDDDHTPLQRAAMKKDWEAVEELVVRDGDPNLLDREGYTVLHRVIEAQQWVAVDLLIQYHADIHKEYNSWYGAKGVTPLSMLIDARQGNIIERTLLWCPNQSKGLNNLRETALHAACLSGCYDSLYYLVARGVNPLAVTYMGQSALVHAVLNKRYPQRMVAECIRLGFSTHQPKPTNIEVDLTSLTSDHSFYQDLCFLPQSVTSPSLCAVLRGLRVVMQMLYESGACSQRELFRLYTELPKLVDPNTVKGRKLQERAGHNLDAYKNFVLHLEDIAIPYLTKIATTPRSLVSTCRLVISHCLTLSKTRHRDVDQLPLTERMKNFVLFSDLTDPDFGKDTT